MADINFDCPECRHNLEVDESGAGMTVPCPECSRPITIPFPALAPFQVKTRACPFCGEQILSVAKKCKHCGEFLDRPPSRPNPSSVTTTPPSPSGHRGLGVFFLFVSALLIGVGLFHMREGNTEKLTRELVELTESVNHDVGGFGADLDRYSSEYSERKGHRQSIMMWTFLIGGVLGVTGLILASGPKN